MSTSWACPGCAGSMNDPKASAVVYILAAFIASTYIPLYLLYKVVAKYKDPQNLPNE